MTLATLSDGVILRLQATHISVVVFAIVNVMTHFLCFKCLNKPFLIEISDIDG